MALFHSIYADLDLVHIQPAEDLFSEEQSVREKDFSYPEIRQEAVYLPKAAVNKGLSSADEDPEALQRLELGQDGADLSDRQLMRPASADITVAAFQIASISDLEFQVPERRNGRFHDRRMHGEGFPRIEDVLFQTVFDEFVSFMQSPLRGCALFKEGERFVIERIEIIPARVINARFLDPPEDRLFLKKKPHRPFDSHSDSIIKRWP
jgi:hypothetical protein